MTLLEFIELIKDVRFEVKVSGEDLTDFPKVSAHKYELSFIDILDLTIPENHHKESQKVERLTLEEALLKFADYEIFKWYGLRLGVNIITDLVHDKYVSSTKAYPLVLIYLEGAWDPTHGIMDETLN
ncbi:MAG: hypothetical protein RBS24_02405 [Bacilli bacterium]|nr:hypothetical protein [Bacilli bacterium]